MDLRYLYFPSKMESVHYLSLRYYVQQKKSNGHNSRGLSEVISGLIFATTLTRSLRLSHTLLHPVLCHTSAWMRSGSWPFCFFCLITIPTLVQVNSASSPRTQLHGPCPSEPALFHLRPKNSSLPFSGLPRRHGCYSFVTLCWLFMACLSLPC